jgi:very-short-patch-repair endonuclease
MKFSTPKKVPASQVKHAKTMRLAMTEPERKLWKALRLRMPLDRTHFRRQVPIGPYIVDFCCFSAKLIVEVDGNQHGSDDAQRRDAARTKALESQGFRVLRFANEDLYRELTSVLDTIAAAIPLLSIPAASPDRAETQPHG